MQVLFENKKLKRICNSAKELRRVYGARMASKIQQRLTELAAASTLEEMQALPAARCHELTGSLRGRFALDLKHPKRLLLKPGHNPLPRLPAGNIDAAKITKVVVVDVMDYHGK